MSLWLRPISALISALIAIAGPASWAQPHQRHGRQPTSVRPESSAPWVLDRMTLGEKVGQLLMVGTPASSAAPATMASISRLHVGNVMLTGRSYAGAAHAGRVARAAQHLVTSQSTCGVRLLVATDQEGGSVQVLHGPGLAEMPSALDQGRLDPHQLRTVSRSWGEQLRASGVNMNFAPVSDTVPGIGAADANPPIGVYRREFGFDPHTVAAHSRAFALGMLGAGVVPVLKHFPGLGRVHANTDTASGVTDYVTTRHDRDVGPFAEAIRAGAPVVMMSTAYYHRIDPHHPAAFSARVISGMLRSDLGFTGVVVSDDLGSARQVSAWNDGDRALEFIEAGGDIVLTVDPSAVPAMYHAVLSRARHSPSFRAKVDAAALRVLKLKEQHRLIGGASCSAELAPDLGPPMRRPAYSASAITHP